MVSKFQCHMEDGLFHTPVTDIDDRLLQWGSILGRKRNELQNYCPSPNSAYAGAVPFQPIRKPGVNKAFNKSGNTRYSNRAPPIILPRDKSGNTACTCYGKRHPGSCGLKSHPNENQNTAIPWCESVAGRTITWLKGPGTSLDIKNGYNTVTNWLVSATRHRNTNQLTENPSTTQNVKKVYVSSVGYHSLNR